MTARLYKRPKSTHGVVRIDMKRGPGGRFRVFKFVDAMAIIPRQKKIFWSERLRKSYKSDFDAKEALSTAEILERELNAGMLSSEADVVFARLGKHDQPIYRVSVLRKNGNPL